MVDPDKWEEIKGKAVSKEDLLIELKRRQAIQAGFKDMRYYVLFIAMFVGITYFQVHTTDAFRTQNTLRTWYVDDPWDQQKTLEDVGEIDDFWGWLNHAVDITWKTQRVLDPQDPWSGYATLSEYNAIVSGVYLRQTRGALIPCPTTKMADISNTCYADESVDADVNPYGTAIQFSYDSSMGGFLEFFSISEDYPQVQWRVNELAANGWIDKQTRYVYVSFYFYNGNTNFFSRAVVKFDFKTNGFIYPSVTFSTINVEPYLQASDWTRLVFEVVFTFFIFLAILVELWELVTSRSREGSFMSYFTSVWNYFDLLSLTLFACMMIMWIFYASFCTTFKQPSDGMPHYSDLKQLESDTDMFADLMRWYHLINALNFFLCMVRFFKFIRFQGKMAILTNTIENASSTIFHFLLIFMVMFCGFAFMGNLTFGHGLYAFHTFPVSFNTCFRMTLGDFDYDAMYKVDPLGAFVFFWGLMILVYFIGMNMFIAILLEEYQDLKSDSTFARSVFQEIRDGFVRRVMYFKDMFNHHLRRKEPAYVSVADMIKSVKDKENELFDPEDLQSMFGAGMAYSLLLHYGQDKATYTTFSDDEDQNDGGFKGTVQATLYLLETVEKKRLSKAEGRDGRELSAF